MRAHVESRVSEGQLVSREFGGTGLVILTGRGIWRAAVVYMQHKCDKREMQGDELGTRNRCNWGVFESDGGLRARDHWPSPISSAAKVRTRVVKHMHDKGK